MAAPNWLLPDAAMQPVRVCKVLQPFAAVGPRLQLQPCQGHPAASERGKGVGGRQLRVDGRTDVARQPYVREQVRRDDDDGRKGKDL